MKAQKCQIKLLVENIGVFERLLTQKATSYQNLRWAMSRSQKCCMSWDGMTPIKYKVSHQTVSFALITKGDKL